MPTDKEKTWSPEPWELKYETAFTRPWIADATGQSVMACIGAVGADRMGAEMGRAVSCVNACSGMSDPERQVEELQHKADLWDALYFIRHHPKCGFGEIATALSVSLGYATDLSDTLVERGFITRGEVEEIEDDAD